MALASGSAWPTAVDSDSTLGPTSGIVAGVTHLGDTGAGQGDQLGITKNLINAIAKVENVSQSGALWCATNGTYVQPAVASTVNVTVYAAPYGTGSLYQGMLVYVQPGLVGGNIGGLYLVQSVNSSTSFTLLNLGGPNNAPATTVIPTLSIIQMVSWASEGPTDQVGLWERTWENTETVFLTANTQPNADWTGTFTGTGVLAPDNTAADCTALNTPSLWQAASGATAISTAVVAAKNIFIPSLTPFEMTFSVAVPALSSGTQTYVFGCGVSTSATAAGSSPFMGIVYSQAGNAFWNLSTGATYTSNLTSTGVTVSIATLYHLRMSLNSGWTSMTVWVNHGAPTTVTANLQTGQVFPVFILNSSVGTSSKVVNWARTKIRLFLPR